MPEIAAKKLCPNCLLRECWANWCYGQGCECECEEATMFREQGAEAVHALRRKQAEVLNRKTLVDKRTQKPVHHVEYSPSFLRKEAEEQNAKFKTITLTQKQFIINCVVVVLAASAGTVTVVLFVRWVIGKIVRF